MTILLCDKCNRTITVDSVSILPNSRCIITKFCKGILHVTNAETPALDLDHQLQDYSARAKLYVHEQPLASYRWLINHNLNTHPKIHVYRAVVNDSKLSHIELDSDDYVIDHKSNVLTVVEFADNISGIAHAISSETANDIEPLPTTTISYLQLTSNTILTIATPLTDADETQMTVTFGFISPTSNSLISVPIVFNAHKLGSSISLFDTPWKTAQLISVNGRLYRVRSTILSLHLKNNKISSGTPFTILDNSDCIILTGNEPRTELVDISNTVALVKNIMAANTTNCVVSDNELLVDAKLSISYNPKLIIIKTIQE
jgi:hypothetical protein